MVNKHVGVCWIIFYCLFPFAVQAAESANQIREAAQESKNYFIKETAEGTVLYQRLSWEAVDDIIGFEWELERKDPVSGDWTLIESRKLTDNFIEVSLPRGYYRYRVIIINLLEQRESVSAYREFEILLAVQPEIDAITPSAVYFDEIDDGTITLEGSGFSSFTHFALKDKNNNTIVQFKDIDCSSDGKTVTLKFDLRIVQPGYYYFSAEDRSGLSTDSRMVSFHFSKPVDIYVSGGYSPSIFGGHRVFKTYFERSTAPLGGYVRLSVLPFKYQFGCFGFNVSASSMQILNKQKHYQLQSVFSYTHLNAVYVRQLIKQRLSFDVHAGFGAAFLTGVQFLYKDLILQSPVYSYWGLSLDVGTALYAYMYKKFYFEVNLDHIISLRRGFPIYTLQPQIGIGWEF